MPTKTQPKKGDSGAVKAMKTKLKALTKEKRAWELAKREMESRVLLMKLRLDAKDRELELRNAELAAASANEESSGVSVANELPQVGEPVEAPQDNKGPKKREVSEGRKGRIPSDPLQQVKAVCEGVPNASVSWSPGGAQLGGGGAAPPIIVGEKIRRPKVSVEEVPKPVFVPPVQNGFIALRGIDEDKMFRPTWYFASVVKGEVKIRRKLSNGVVRGIKTSGLDDVKVLEVIKVDTLPKCNHKWVRPDRLLTSVQQQNQQQTTTVQRKTAATSEGENSGELTSSPSVLCKKDAMKVSTKTATTPMPIVKVPTTTNGVKDPVPGCESSKPQTTAQASGAKKSAAQAVSDDAAWEEILPMVDDVLASEAWAAVKASESQVFRNRCENGPFAAVAKGRFLTTLNLRTSPINDLATKALALSTVKAHKRMLRFLKQIPEKFWDLSLERALEQYFVEAKTLRRWLPTTMVVKMATAHGALRLLPLYAERELPVMMKESVVWMQAMKAAAKMAKQQPPKQPTAATWAEVEEALKKEPSQSVRMATLITWLACGRGGDVLLLKPKDVEMTAKETPKGVVEGMAISFWKGKTVKTRGSYTVFTQRPPGDLLEQFLKYQGEMKNEDYLFKGVRGAQIKEALRRANPNLEQRSLRRGAIQTLAKTGLTDSELLHYSGHTNVAMLRRYLNFGKLSGEGAKLSAQAVALVSTH